MKVRINDEHCVLCQGSWDPETGFVVGSPQEHKVCGECFQTEMLPLLRPMRRQRAESLARCGLVGGAS